MNTNTNQYNGYEAEYQVTKSEQKIPRCWNFRCKLTAQWVLTYWCCPHHTQKQRVGRLLLHH